MVENFSWVSGSMPTALQNGNILRCTCRIRHRQALQMCEVVVEDHEGGNEMFLVHFIGDLQWAVSSGQVLALYSEKECLGGGNIINF